MDKQPVTDHKQSTAQYRKHDADMMSRQEQQPHSSALMVSTCWQASIGFTVIGVHDVQMQMQQDIARGLHSTCYSTWKSSIWHVKYGR
jgi:hypothetical protein